jgi:stearoyl-CoA desaturase (delta-9 desaturase)
VPSRDPLAPPPDLPDEAPHDTIYPSRTIFVLAHLVCFAALYTGVTTTAVVLAIVLYVTRMFGVTAGYHRYFSHRSFKTSRVTQFLFAVLAQSSAQKGVMWWAALHRHHHKWSDTEYDIHSPHHGGFWHSHVGWIFEPANERTDLDAVPDLAAYPELRWLDRWEHVPTVLAAVLCFLIGGWPGLVVGFFWSTVATWHGTFMINSMAHVHGNKRYVTGDDSRNNWWLALVTLGEGWHNNHHAYQRSTRQGFRWYEIDITYYVLWAMSKVGLVWDLGAPPADVIANERPLGRKVLEKVARQLALSFPVEQLVAEARAAQAERSAQWSQQLADMRHSAEDAIAHAGEAFASAKAQAGEALSNARAQAHDAIAAAKSHLPAMPHLPTVDEMRARAQEMFADTPSLDDIAVRARELLAESVAARMAVRA